MALIHDPSFAPASVAGKTTPNSKLSADDRRILVESVGRDMESIDRAYCKRDETHLLECIHSLKGALFIVGEHAVANDCAEAEKSIRARGIAHCKRDIQRLKASLRHLLQCYGRSDESPHR